MRNRAFSTIMSVNTVFQAVACLLSPMAAAAFVSWLLTKNGIVGPWIYAVLVPLGALIGLVAMIGYVVKAAEAEKAMKNAEKEETDEDD